MKISIINIIANIVGGPFAALAGAIFGTSEIELYAGLQAQAVFALEQMRAPGQGVTTIRYDQPTIMYRRCKVNWFLFVPTS